MNGPKKTIIPKMNGHIIIKKPYEKTIVPGQKPDTLDGHLPQSGRIGQSLLRLGHLAMIAVPINNNKNDPAR